MQLLVGPTFICSTATGVNSLFKKEKAKSKSNKKERTAERRMWARDLRGLYWTEKGSKHIHACVEFSYVQQ